MRDTSSSDQLSMKVSSKAFQHDTPDKRSAYGKHYIKKAFKLLE